MKKILTPFSGQWESMLGISLYFITTNPTINVNQPILKLVILRTSPGNPRWLLACKVSIYRRNNGNFVPLPAKQNPIFLFPSIIHLLTCKWENCFILKMDIKYDDLNLTSYKVWYLYKYSANQEAEVQPHHTQHS